MLPPRPRASPRRPPQVVWLEDDDLVHLADRSYAVYRLARDKGPVLESWEAKPHGVPALLAVERAMQTLDVRATPPRASSPRPRPPSPSPGAPPREACCIHRLNPLGTPLQMEVEQIMKGDFEHFMAKEIFEQPESLQGTMRGRIIPPSEGNPHGRIHLGGLVRFVTPRLAPLSPPRPRAGCLASHRIAS